MTYVHINAPRPVEVSCVIIDCPVCQRKRRALAKYYEWYGATVVCAGCGDRWNDGEMEERPFMPRWRQKSIEHAREELAAIGIQS